MNLAVRTMLESELDRADAIFLTAFGQAGSRKAEFAMYYRLQPDGQFLATCDGEPVGFVQSIDYGPFAYIGSMSVLPPLQRRGIGRKLMEHLTGWLDARGCSSMHLDASQAGEHLYPKLGFVGDGCTAKYRRYEGARPPQRANGVRRMTSRDLVAIAAFDEPIFGADRLRVLSAYLAALPDRAFVLRDSAGAVSGYAFAGRWRIGPWVARGPEEAATLLDTVLSLDFDGPSVVCAPSENRDVRRVVEGAGFRDEGALLHMHRGAAMPGDRTHLYALASFAIG